MNVTFVRRGAPLLTLAMAGACATEIPRRVAPLRYDDPRSPGDDTTATPVPTPVAPVATSEEPKLGCEPALSATLSNGMRVVVAERHAYPSIAVRLALAADPAEPDPGGVRLGFTGSVHFDPTASGVDARTTCSRAGCILGTWITAGHLDEALRRLVTLTASSPDGDSGASRRLERALRAWRFSATDPWQSLDRNGRVALFGRTFWGEPDPLPQDPTPRELARVREHLLTGASATLVIAGDVSSEEARRAAERFFGNWPAGVAHDPSAIHEDAGRGRGSAAAPLGRARVVRIDTNTVTQTLAHVVALGPGRDEPDAPAFSAAIHLLGGGMASQVFRRVREDMGAAYLIDADVFWASGVSMARIGGSFDDDKAIDGIRAMVASIETMRTHGVSEVDLRRGRAALRAAIRSGQATAARIAESLAQEALGVSSGEICAHAAHAEEITTADVQRVAKKYFDPQRAALVVVARADKVGLWLSELKLGPIERRDGLTRLR